MQIYCKVINTLVAWWSRCAWDTMTNVFQYEVFKIKIHLESIFSCWSYLPASQPTYLPTNQRTYLQYQPTYPPTYQLTYLPTYLPPSRPTYLPTYLPTNLPSCLPTYPAAYLPSCLLTYPAAYLPTQLLTYLPTQLLTYLPAAYLFTYLLAQVCQHLFLVTSPRACRWVWCFAHSVSKPVMPLGSYLPVFYS